MNYKQIDSSTYVVSVGPGEEIIEQLQIFLVKECIDNAFINGIGAVDCAELGHYSVAAGQYSTRNFDIPLEIASLTGNAFLNDGKPLAHIHAVMSDDQFKTIGGHLVKAVVSAACEIIVIKLPSKLIKSFNHSTGLRMLELE